MLLPAFSGMWGPFCRTLVWLNVFLSLTVCFCILDNFTLYTSCFSSDDLIFWQCRHKSHLIINLKEKQKLAYCILPGYVTHLLLTNNVSCAYVFASICIVCEIQDGAHVYLKFLLANNSLATAKSACASVIICPSVVFIYSR